MKVNLTRKDHRQLEKMSLSQQEIQSQLAKFRTGSSFIPLKKPATIGNGILSPSRSQKEAFINGFRDIPPHRSIEHFIPASGAATRMFKNLYPFVENSNVSLSPEEQEENKRFLDEFLKGFHDQRFPFSDKLKQYLSSHSKDDPKRILSCLLSPDGLNYGQLPKALIGFHRYPEGSRTPIDEHIVDGISLAEQSSGTASFHFTLSREHEQTIGDHLSSFVKGLRTNVSPVCTWSFQEDNTSTLAVDLDDTPVRDEKNQLVFRPGGHGALLQNLNRRTADIVFLKNIDNVAHQHLKEIIMETRMMMGGYLHSIQSRIFSYLETLHKQHVSVETIGEIITFCQTDIGIPTVAAVGRLTPAEQIQELIRFLNRPIRVCGMVRNQGEPGGGPFWVTGRDGASSLQIVEKAQIDVRDSLQRKILHESTHFNPVDMVCGIRNFQGDKFDLHRYCDDDTFFVSIKSIRGHKVKALELPGLWNGSMAHWITLMIEIPLETFNPVKTINDLLRPSHQPKSG